jgi:hypothetical protein
MTIKMITIKLLPKNKIKDNLKVNNKYFILDNNKICYGKYVRNYIRKENRFIFENVYFIKSDHTTNLLSTTDLFLSEIIKLDFGLPTDIQRLIEDFY